MLGSILLAEALDKALEKQYVMGNYFLLPTDIFDVSFEGKMFADLSLFNGSFSCSVFKDCSFINARFEGTCFDFVTFEGCSFQNVLLIGCSLEHTSWQKGCKLSNFQLQER